MIPGLLHDIFSAIIIVEKRGIKTHAVKLDRIAPGAANIGRGGQIVSHVFKGAFGDFDIGIH